MVGNEIASEVQSSNRGGVFALLPFLAEIFRRKFSPPQGARDLSPRFPPNPEKFPYTLATQKRRVTWQCLVFVINSPTLSADKARSWLLLRIGTRASGNRELVARVQFMARWSSWGKTRRRQKYLFVFPSFRRGVVGQKVRGVENSSRVLRTRKPASPFGLSHPAHRIVEDALRTASPRTTAQIPRTPENWLRGPRGQRRWP